MPARLIFRTIDRSLADDDASIGHLLLTWYGDKATPLGGSRRRRCRVYLFCCFDQYDAGNRIEIHTANSFHGRRRMEQHPPLCRRNVESVFRMLGREQTIPQQALQLPGAIGVSVADRGALDTRPNAPSVGSDDQQSTVSR